MQNNFNDTVHQLKDFSLTPAGDVWNEIESNLDEKKKRRIVGWWWSLPVLGLLTFSVLINNKNNSIKLKNGVISEKNSPVSAENSQTLDKNNDISVKNSETLDKNNATSVKNSKTPYKNNDISVKNTKTLYKNNATSVNNSKTLDKHNDISAKNIQTLSKNNVNTLDDQDIIDKQTRTLDNRNAITNVDSTITMVNLSKKEIDTNKIYEKIVKKLIPKPAKKIQYSLAFGGGANYLSHSNIFGSQENSSNSLGNLTSTTGSATPGQIRNNNTLPLPKTGFSFSLGVNVDFALSKKWRLQSGIAYKYLQNSLSVNNAVANTFSVGNNLNYKSHFHLLEIPLNIVYCLNPNTKNKLSLIGGATVDLSLGNNWLYANNEQGYYLVEKSNINSVFFGLQTGASINFNNKFSLSLLAQKSITPIQKSSSKYYWQQLNLQFNVPLGK